MKGKKDVTGAIRKYVAHYGKGSVIFNDEDLETGVYSVLRGLVAIYEGNRESPSSHMAKASAAFHFPRPRRVWQRPLSVTMSI